MAQEKCSTSSQTVLYQITLTVSLTNKTPPSTETEQTPFPSIHIVTSPTAPVKHNNHPPQPTPYKPTPSNQPPTNQPPQTNPLQTKYFPKVGMGNKPKTQEVPKVGTGDKPKTKEVPKMGTGAKPKKKEVPKVGMGDKPQISEVPNVGTGDKQKTNKVPKVGAGEAQMVPMEEPPQRNLKFEQDRKRCITDTNGKNPQENKRVHRDACVSDLVWPVKL